MSLNPATRDGIPIVISPEERFIVSFSETSFVVESGNGYPGSGGCFYGSNGTTFISKYRVVYVESNPSVHTLFRAFSLPLYALFENNITFYRGYLGKRSFSGTVSNVPGGGLPVVPGFDGNFTITFRNGGLTEFEDTIRPLIQDAQELRREILAVNGAAIALLPKSKEEESTTKAAVVAYINPAKPFDVFIEKV